MFSYSSNLSKKYFRGFFNKVIRLPLKKDKKNSRIFCQKMRLPKNALFYARFLCSPFSCSPCTITYMDKYLRFHSKSFFPPCKLFLLCFHISPLTLNLLMSPQTLVLLFSFFFAPFISFNPKLFTYFSSIMNTCMYLYYRTVPFVSA